MRLVISYPEIDPMTNSYGFEGPTGLRSDFRVGHENEENVDFSNFVNILNGAKHSSFTIWPNLEIWVFGVNICVVPAIANFRHHKLVKSHAPGGGILII